MRTPHQHQSTQYTTRGSRTCTFRRGHRCHRHIVYRSLTHTHTHTFRFFCSLFVLASVALHNEWMALYSRAVLVLNAKKKMSVWPKAWWPRLFPDSQHHGPFSSGLPLLAGTHTHGMTKSARAQSKIIPQSSAWRTKQSNPLISPASTPA